MCIFLINFVFNLLIFNIYSFSKKYIKSFFLSIIQCSKNYHFRIRCFLLNNDVCDCTSNFFCWFFLFFFAEYFVFQRFCSKQKQRFLRKRVLISICFIFFDSRGLNFQLKKLDIWHFKMFFFRKILNEMQTKNLHLMLLFVIVFVH